MVNIRGLKSLRRKMGLFGALSLTLTRRAVEDSRPSNLLPGFLPWDCSVIEVHSCWTLQFLLPRPLETGKHMSVYSRPIAALDLFPDFQDIAQLGFPRGQSGFLKSVAHFKPARLSIWTNAAWVQIQY